MARKYLAEGKWEVELEEVQEFKNKRSDMPCNVGD
jgi:hypothetical protein